MVVWREWTPRQIHAYYRLCRREAWRQQAWELSLAGGSPSPEPEWDLDGSRARYYRDEFETIKRMRERR